MAIESLGVVRVARQVLLTIVTHTALQIPGITRMAYKGDSCHVSSTERFPDKESR